MRSLPASAVFLGAACLMAPPLFAQTPESTGSAPAWSFEHGDGIGWYEIMPTGHVAVATENQLHLLDPDTGTEVVTFRPWSRPRHADISPVMGTSLALITPREFEGQPQGPQYMLDLTTYDTLWSAPRVVLDTDYGLCPDPSLTFVLAATGREDEVERGLAAIDLATGAVRWEAPRLMTRLRAQQMMMGLRGGALQHQLPLFDTDSTAVLYLSPHGPARIDLRTGELVWEQQELPKYQPNHYFPDTTLTAAPYYGFARMRLVGGGDAFYAPCDNRLLLCDLADGHLRWPDPPALNGKVERIIDLDGGVLVQTRALNSELPSTWLYLIDGRTGEVRWFHPKPEGGFLRRFVSDIFGTWTDATPVVVRDGAAYIGVDTKLYRIDLDSGKKKEIARLKLEYSGLRNLEVTEQGFFLLADREIQALDPSGKAIWRKEIPAPSNFGVGVVLLAASAVTTVATPTIPVGSGSVSIAVDPSVGLDAIMREYEATSSATDYLYLLAMVESEGKTVPGIARVRKSDGEIVSTAPVWKKQPLYFVDHSRLRIVFKRDKKELMSIPFE